MRDVIPLMTIIEELSEVLNIKKETPKIFCTVFEDNNGQQVKDGKIKIEAVDTNVQIADAFIKPLPRLQFETLRRTFLGW